MTEFTFTDPETVTLADVRLGDFIVEVPTQGGILGTRIDSGLASRKSSWEPDYRGTVYEQRTGRRGRWQVETLRLTFLTGGAVLYYPASFAAVVRRRVESPAA